jgi:hypothetical protein
MKGSTASTVAVPVCVQVSLSSNDHGIPMRSVDRRVVVPNPDHRPLAAATTRCASYGDSIGSAHARTT